MTQDERSIPEMTRDVATHLADMFRNELRLARVETADGVKSLSGGAAMILAGTVIGVPALTIAMLAAVYGLSEVLPMWGAAAVVAALGLGLAAVLLLSGKAAFKANELSLPRTREQLKQDIDNISEHVHQ